MAEVHLTPRQVAVAKAYIEGLERDRARVEVLGDDLNKTTWEGIQLASYNRALYQLVRQLVDAFDNGKLDISLINRAEDLLEANRPLYESIWSCECGHSKYDHDEQGHCLFLGCRRICG